MTNQIPSQGRTLPRATETILGSRVSMDTLDESVTLLSGWTELMKRSAWEAIAIVWDCFAPLAMTVNIFVHLLMSRNFVTATTRRNLCTGVGSLTLILSKEGGGASQITFPGSSPGTRISRRGRMYRKSLY